MAGFIFGRRLQPHEVVGATVVGLSLLWTLKLLLREFARSIFPQALPGEKNTALLASPRPNSSTAATAKDLESVVEYDYIIIGTGTAGCVLANRLSVDRKVSVLAIEAGHSDLNQIMSRIPAGLTKLMKTPVDWAFKTTPQPKCNDRELDWPRGKMIGGCSSNNAMMYTKGAPDDYDEWERLGNKGWGYKNVAPYLNKSEGFRQPKDDDERKLPSDDLAQHGRSGPWSVSYAWQAKINKIFPYACEAVGINKVKDINTDRGILGATPVQTFIDSQGQRSSTAVAYLTADVVKRPNLKIASGQNVTQIIFDTTESTPRAVGIEMAASKATPIRYLAKARKEVLLCAGSIGSPQLLKLSGVGPTDELKELSIPVIKDLPAVGENLVDHMAFHGLTFKTPKDVSSHQLQDPIKSIPGLIEWLRYGTGTMSGQSCDSFAFVRTSERDDAPASLKAKDLTSGPTSADLELMAISLCFTDHGAFVAPQTSGYSSISAVGLRPESRGNVKLASKDPFAVPIIDPKILSSEHDLDLLLYGTKLAIKIARSEPYKKYFKGWYIGPHHPIDWDTATDEQIKDHIRNTSETLYHPMCTAKMGPSSTDSVVDGELRVHGVSSLRVIDASVFPTPVACHPCAPVVAVAERAADLIKGDVTRP